MKKLLAFLPVLCMLFSCLPMAVFSEEAENPESAETLRALGIMEGFGNDLMPDKVLTRAEFVTLITRILKIDDTFKTAYFEDVSEDHWAVGSIATACSLGIVEGVGEKLFLPDEPVAYEEAVKMLVVALGYRPMAEAKGGYPSGYLMVASQIGLLDSVNGEAGMIIKRRMAADLIFNALSAEMVSENEIGEKTKVSMDRDKTLLSERMKIEKKKGIVMANDVTDLTAAGGVANGMVRIGDKLFESGTTGAEEFLGYAVTYYADISDPTVIPTLVYVRLDSKHNEITTVSSFDILESTTVREFSYDEEGREKEIAVSPYADLIYNGVALSGFTANDMMPKNGEVTLIDNNSDGEADVLLVYDYETILVGSIVKDRCAVYDSENGSKYVELDPMSKDYSCLIYSKGKLCQFKTIQTDGVLSVAKSKNTTGKKKIIAQYSAETAVGILDSINQDYVVIGETEYNILPEKRGEASKYLGCEVTAYLDVFGDVAGIKEGANQPFVYGYLIASDAKSGIDTNVTFKILTEAGKVERIKAAKTISLDGKKAVDPSVAVQELANTVRGLDYDDEKEATKKGSGIEQVVRYRLNGNGEINAFDTVAFGKGDVNDSLERVLARLPGTTKRRMYGNAVGDTTFDFVLENDMIVFIIPPKENKSEDERYTKESSAHIAAGQYYDLEAYDFTDNHGVRVALEQMASDGQITALTNAKPFFVEKISTAEQDGSTVYKLTGIQNGAATTVYAEDASVIKKNVEGKDIFYETGDVVMYVLNSKGMVANITPLFVNGIHEDTKCGSFGYDSNSTKFYAQRNCTFAYLTRIDNLYLLLETAPWDETNNKVFPMQAISSTRYFLVSAKKKTLNTITKEAVEQYIYGRGHDSKVMTFMESGTMRDVIVFDYE